MCKIFHLKLLYRYCGIIIFFAITQVCKSQTNYPGNLYVYNKYLLNSAYAGYENELSALLAYRSSSLSIKGAPKRITFGMHSSVLSNMGLGLRIDNKSEGLFNFFSGFVDYSYRLNLSSEQSLRFGISGGLKVNQLDNSSIIATNPSAVIEIATSNFLGTSFESAAGIVYENNKLELSISVPRLFGTSKEFNPNFASWLSYHIHTMGNKIILTPNVYALYVPGTPLLYDINLMANWQEKFQLGLGYRNRPAVVLNLGLIITNMKINYAAEFATEKYANIFNTVHEVSVTYQFKKVKKTPQDSLYNPPLQQIVEIDTVSVDTVSVNNLDEEVVNIQDSLMNIHSNNDEKDYEITEVADGVFVLKPKNEKTININDTEVDSLLNTGMLFEFEEKNEGAYEMVELGNGIFGLKRNDTINLPNEIPVKLVDSLVALNVFATENDLSITDSNDDFDKEYYTILVLVNNKSDVLLNNHELIAKLSVERDEKGKLNYFYGQYSTKNEALQANIYLSENGVKNTKIIKRTFKN